MVQHRSVFYPFLSKRISLTDNTNPLFVFLFTLPSWTFFPSLALKMFFCLFMWQLKDLFTRRVQTEQLREVKQGQSTYVTCAAKENWLQLFFLILHKISFFLPHIYLPPSLASSPLPPQLCERGASWGNCAKVCDFRSQQRHKRIRGLTWRRWSLPASRPGGQLRPRHLRGELITAPRRSWAARDAAAIAADLPRRPSWCLAAALAQSSDHWWAVRGGGGGLDGRRHTGQRG